MCCFSSTIKSGALDFVPLQFAVFRISSFPSWRGLHSISMLDTPPAPPAQSPRPEVHRGSRWAKASREAAVNSRCALPMRAAAQGRLPRPSLGAPRSVARAGIKATEDLTEEAARVEPARRR
jgi:hypothetical protein